MTAPIVGARPGRSLRWCRAGRRRRRDRRPRTRRPPAARPGGRSRRARRSSTRDQDVGLVVEPDEHHDVGRGPAAARCPAEQMVVDDPARDRPPLRGRDPLPVERTAPVAELARRPAQGPAVVAALQRELVVAQRLPPRRRIAVGSGTARGDALPLVTLSRLQRTARGAAGDVAGLAGRERDLGAGHLALAGRPAQLRDRFGGVVQAVDVALRQVAAVGVDGQRAAESRRARTRPARPASPFLQKP